MAEKDDQVEKHIGKAKLEKLARTFDGAQSRMADERGELGRAIKNAVEKDHLDKWAFKTAMELRRMNDSGRQSRRLRALSLYCDHFGLGGQEDLVDAIDAAQARDGDDESGADGEGDPSDEQTVNDVLAGGEADEFDTGENEQQSTLRKFREAIAEPGMISRQIRRAMDSFIADHPALAGEAEEIAAKRLAELAAAKTTKSRSHLSQGGETVN